ncbi:MAG: hypothetical protein HQ483_10815 [Rhodospirillales bacterium]|nr:hypothetical protein [Rhodospirillales bacterium]
MASLSRRPGEHIVTSEHVFSPRELGAIAYIEGKVPADNPFSPLEIEYDDWLDGYACEFEFVSDNFDACFGASLGSA